MCRELINRHAWDVERGIGPSADAEHFPKMDGLS